MVIPSYAEGRDEDHPDLQRDPRTSAEKNLQQESKSENTRKGGQVQEEEPVRE